MSRSFGALVGISVVDRYLNQVIVVNDGSDLAMN